MADPTFNVLSAMITPAVLISGAGTLIMSTSTRLGRSTDRVRGLTARFKVLVSEEGQKEPMARQEKALIIGQLPRLTRRTRYLHRALRAFYLAVAFLVLTSILIGVDSLMGLHTGGLPVAFAVVGASVLAYGSLLLSFESTQSSITTRREMEFLEELGSHYASLYEPPEEAGAGTTPRP